MTVQQVSVNFITRYSSRGIRQFQRDMATVGSTAQATAGTTSAALAKVGSASQAAGTALLIGVGAALAIGIKAAIDFEDAFAGVRKTVEASEPEFEALAMMIRQMSLEIPIAATELAKIAELGGQLGVPVEGLEDFTEVVAKLGVTTNLEIDEAATSLARFTNVMGSSDKDFSKIASALVDLGNNVAAQEDEILAFATRLAGIGAVVGLTEGEVLGLAAAFVELGVPAERGATAVQRTFISMLEAVQNGGAELTTFAETAGMTIEDFIRTFEEDPAKALIEFERGLGRIANAGGNVTGVLDEVGLGSQRVTESLLKGAGSWQSLESNVRRGNRALEENVALDIEAAERFGTMKSQIQLLFNQFRDLRVEVGQRAEPAFRDLLGTFGGLFEVIQENFGVLEKLATLVFVLAGARGLLALGKGIAGTAVLFGEASTKLTGLGVAGLNAQARLAKVGTVVKGLGGVLGLATVALGGLAVAMGVNRARANQNREAISALADEIERLRDGANNLQEVREAFRQALIQPDALFDATIDLNEYRDFILDLGESSNHLVDLAIEDFERFGRVTDGITDSLRRQIEEIRTRGGTLTEIQIQSGALSPDEMTELEIRNQRLSTWLRILTEITTATEQLRQEEERRRREADIEGGTGKNFPRGRGARVTGTGFLTGSGLTLEEYNDTLDKMQEATTDFGDDFLDNWQDIVDGFTDVIFDFETAFDEFEATTEFNLGALTTSMDEWVKEQQQITSALEFVVSQFGTDAAALFISLPQEVQAQLGAALAGGAGSDIMEFWGNLITQNESLIQERLLRALLIAPSTVSTLLGDWQTFFDNELVPLFEEAGGVKGSEAFNEAVAQMFPMLLTQIGEEAPELAIALGTMLNEAAEEASTRLDPAKLGTVINTLRSDLTSLEKVQALVAIGVSWADAIALGFSTLNLKFRTAGSEAAESVNTQFQKDLIIDSPSKVFQRHGEMVGAGFNKGVLDSLKPITLDARINQRPRIQPVVSSGSVTEIHIHHPNHPTDDLTADLQRASVLAGFQRIAESRPLSN